MKNRYRQSALIDFGAAIFSAVGVAAEPARVASELLVRADQREVSTHGLVRIVPYVRRIRSGFVNVSPSLAELRRRTGYLLIDGDDGLGQVTASKAAAEAIKLVKDVGFGVVGVKNSHHLGMCAPYAEEIAKAGNIGFMLTNAAPLMAPSGSAKRMLGNNPLAIAVPRRGHPPIVVDVSFSHTSFGLIQQFAAQGKELPAGWIHDNEGRWINDAAKAIAEGIMAPIGGHKGYGLALIVELLAAALTDSNVLDDVGSLFPRKAPSYMRVGHLAIAIDPEMLLGRDLFFDRVEDVCRRLVSAPPLPGIARVKLPGEPEQEAEARSAANGIRLSANIVSELQRLADELAVRMPSAIELQEAS